MLRAVSEFGMGVESAAGVREVEVPAEAAGTAAALGGIVREVAATGGLPFGADPGDFLAALERLAPADDGVGGGYDEVALP